MLEMTIAAEGSYGACLRAPKICDRYHTPHATQSKPMAEPPGSPWAGGSQAEACFPYGLCLIRSASSRQRRDACTSFLTELGHANTVCPMAGDATMPVYGREDGGAQGLTVMARTWGTSVRASLSQRKPTAAARQADAGPVRLMPLFVGRRICPSSVDRPNGKAGCAATYRRCVERGTGCQALPLAPRVGKSGV
jgi:hypothetical protein